MVRNILKLFLITSIFLSCQSETQEKESNVALGTPALFTYLTPDKTQIDFVNTIQELEQFNILLYENLYNGGGVAIGDINNDGLNDIYFSGNTVSNKLYLNQGDFVFKDITESSGTNGGLGFKTGISMVDVNQDGYLDIYVCKSGVANPQQRANTLYINNGDLTFSEQAKEYGLDDMSYTAQAYFFDSDSDGDLDVYMINHPNNWKESNRINLMQDASGNLVKTIPPTYDYISDRYYEQTASGFIDRSETAGILNNTFSHSAVIADFNNDAKLDLYICNDYIGSDQLLINQGDHTFKDEVTDFFKHTSFSSMGSDAGDVNNDGLIDIFTLDMSPKDNYRRKMMSMAQNYDKFEKLIKYNFGAQFPNNTLQINTGQNKFLDISFIDNVAQSEWSWSVLMADFDNDGFKDIHVTNGYLRDITNNDYRQYEFDRLQRQLKAKELTLLEWIELIPSDPVSSFLFQNQGGLRFVDKSAPWGSGPPAFSSGSAYGDLNNDGYLDIVVNNLNKAPFIMKNTGAEILENTYLSVSFTPKSRAKALGSRVQLLLDDGSVLTEYYQPSRGFYSSSQHNLHFGIKKGLKPLSLDILWPDQTAQTVNALGSESHIVVAKDGQIKTTKSETTTPFFVDNTELLSSNFAHKENEFIDFKVQQLLHKKLSEEGPAIAIGDVNGDGLEDLYFGGALSFSGQILLQGANGRWSPNTTPFIEDKMSEDVDAVFFDYDNDGDLDLYVVSGGNEYPKDHALYADRLYINNGFGNFTRDTTALPELFNSGSVVRVFDHNKDGLQDLYIGGFVSPGRYPEAPRSTLLYNRGDKFIDRTKDWSEGLEFLGMISDAIFADLDGDASEELIIAGEWLPITVFSLVDDKWTNSTQHFGLHNTRGWWQSIATVDTNNDGRLDIIAGNLGLNSIFKASEKEPTTLIYKDFDNNGSIDAILCTYNDGVSYPIHNRDRMLNHMVMLKKRFTRYAPYARATIDEIFTPEELEDTAILTATTFEHAVFINNGKGSFNRSALPFETQWSVLSSIAPWDIDHDGQMELIVGGNYYGTDAEFSRYDASIGNILRTGKDGAFDVLPFAETGLILDGNVRQLRILEIGKEPYLFMVRNNDSFKLFKPTRITKK
ncbi:MAG: hypothetical protein ABR84_06930 [Cryomorphaceae bacterium BACL21 MAG-121220-bin10]|jgi:enediyne biosynthesis protein E4|nr:MAG: hypothetical protein ABR84_06930 [Cryomorphaceae bacterium BACL21 MAG-121220-bin10]